MMWESGGKYLSESENVRRIDYSTLRDLLWWSARMSTPDQFALVAVASQVDLELLGVRDHLILDLGARVQLVRNLEPRVFI